MKINNTRVAMAGIVIVAALLIMVLSNMPNYSPVDGRVNDIIAKEKSITSENKSTLDFLTNKH